jgi:hypothetical protein
MGGRAAMNAGSQIAVIGATGVTGAYAFDAAAALGLVPLAVGRDAGKLRAFLAKRELPENRGKIIDVKNLKSIQSAFAGVEAVISTVMPFSANGLLIARAAAEMGIGYTDPSGEAVFIEEVINSLDKLALKTRATLCPGNGAAAFLGDVALHWIVDPAKHRVGGVLYDIHGYQPSYGSFKSYLESILPAGGPRIRSGRIELRPMGFSSGSVHGIAGYHTIVPDALVVSRYWSAETFDALGKAGALPRPLIRFLAGCVTGTILSRWLLKLPFDRWLAYDPAADAKSSITVHVECGTGDGILIRRVVKGHGIYSLTGRILAATANALLNRDSRPTGIRAASEMFASFEQVSAQTGIELLASPNAS